MARTKYWIAVAAAYVCYIQSQLSSSAASGTVRHQAASNIAHIAQYGCRMVPCQQWYHQVLFVPAVAQCVQAAVQD